MKSKKPVANAKKAKSFKKPRHPKATITFRHNFLPVILGFLMFIGILGVLNNQWLTAQAEYRFAPKVYASNDVTDYSVKAPNQNTDLDIPSIQVNAPIMTNVPDYTEWKIQLALRQGVVHLPDTALPGEAGNVVIIGHSSGQAWAPGNYKFVFTLLDKLKTNQLVFVDYQGTRYIYRVTGSEVVTPSDFDVLKQTKDPELTLITCTPVGTSTNRLVIHAKQVSPAPSKAKHSTATGAGPLGKSSALPN